MGNGANRLAFWPCSMLYGAFLSRGSFIFCWGFLGLDLLSGCLGRGVFCFGGKVVV